MVLAGTFLPLTGPMATNPDDGYTLSGVAEANPDVALTDETDLTPEMIAETCQTYRDCAELYLKQVERNPRRAKKVQTTILEPFLAQHARLCFAGPILFAGCGTGRDLQTTLLRGIAAVGVDGSPEMIGLAERYVPRTKISMMDMSELVFMDDCFTGLYCETALNHNPRSLLPRILEGFRRVLLKPIGGKGGGIAFFGFRRGEGQVYFTADLNGRRRFNLSFTVEQAQALLQSAGFAILDVRINPVPNIPQMIDIIAQVD